MQMMEKILKIYSRSYLASLLHNAEKIWKKYYKYIS